ncbi:MAG: hypothetical protein M0T86_07440 [Betaproteobacteria bacterium]|nr:hypothetical protein [Betaproteobacteria bacterium]
MRPQQTSAKKSAQQGGKARHINTGKQQDTIATHVLDVGAPRDENAQGQVLDRLLARQTVHDAQGRILATAFEPRVRLSGTTPELRLADDTTLIAALYNLTENERTPRYPLLASIDQHSLALRDIDYLPAPHVIFSLHAASDPDNPLVALINRRLKSGFRLLLEQSDDAPVPMRLIGVVREARIDTREFSAPRLEQKIIQLRHFGIQRIHAAHIDCQEMLGHCIKLKLDSYQGDACNQLTPRGLPSIGINRLKVLELIDLAVAGKPPREIAAHLRSDARLTYQMLACASRTVGDGAPAASVEQVAEGYGMQKLYDWLILLLRNCTAPDAAAQQTLRRSLSRACFLDTLAKKSLLGFPADSAWLIGLLSLTGELLQQPPLQCLAPLRLDENIRLALLEHKGVGGMLLELAVATENADHHAIEHLAARCLVNIEDVNLAMVNALVLAESTPF